MMIVFDAILYGTLAEVVSVDELGSGIADIRPQSLANLMKVRAPTAA